MAGPKRTTIKQVNPKPSTPGVKARVLQQQEASRAFGTASEAARRAAITKPMGAKFSGSHPTPAPIGKGYQPPKPKAQPTRPSSVLGTRGESNISKAIGAGLKRKGLIYR